ncbi:hypothetical protein NMG60_11013850 [Bertholletia excelsa]
MEATGMDVEEADLTTSSSKRFGLKNSIETNFGDDYVFEIVPKDDGTMMAVSLSTNTMKLYSPSTGQYFGELKGHSSTINQIAFSNPVSPHVLHSCSSDGTIRAWDTRTLQQVSSICSGPSLEIFSFSLGGTDYNLLAAGSNSQIFFWDWRSKKQIACLEESHMEDVTQVHFVPHHQNKLVSASVDGLMCIYDTSGSINDDDDNLESVMNVGTSIGKVGFFGQANQKLWCLTHIETLSVWEWKDAKLEVNFEDARSLASDSWALDHVDYFVECHSSGEGDHLWVIGGTNAGTLGYFPVNCTGRGGIGPPEAILHGGHTGIVRTVLPESGIRSGQNHRRGIFGWTGGEDGRLCCWMSDALSSINGSWSTGKLVMKTQRTCKRSRHQPY